ILNKIKYYISTKVKLMLYNALVLPHINYCLLAWGYEHQRITKLQKKIVRLITGSKYNAHTEPLFKSIKILKIEHI
ncbi:MAG: hypothetical protein ACC656_15730, partial [Candidatus Heimdallarchaeota archaeon]